MTRQDYLKVGFAEYPLAFNYLLRAFAVAQDEQDSELFDVALRSVYEGRKHLWEQDND